MKKNQLYGKWIEVELRPDKFWVIIESVLWVRPTGEKVFLTPYFITDYATTPRPIRSIFPRRSNTYDIAAAFHDDCIVKGRLQGITNNPACHRIFNELAKKYGTPSWQRFLMYRSVQVYGIAQVLRLSLMPDKDYAKYFGWKLTPQEIYRYNKIIRKTKHIQQKTLTSELPEMNVNERTTYKYDEFTSLYKPSCA